MNAHQPARWPALRGAAAIAYVTLMSIVLLQSSGQPVIGPAAPPGPPDPIREVFLTSMHLLGFGGLTAVLWWAFAGVGGPRRALGIALAFALVYSPATELLQTLMPDRGPSWGDLLMNTLAMLLIAGLIAAWLRRAPSRPR